jgi:hypothetical protein
MNYLHSSHKKQLLISSTLVRSNLIEFILHVGNSSSASMPLVGNNRIPFTPHRRKSCATSITLEGSI